MVRRPHQPRGMALVDIIVATVMLGIALTAMLGIAGRALSSQKSGENLQTAAMLLDERLNLILARGIDDYASRFNDLEGDCDAPFEAFRYQVEIGSASAGFATAVTATVFWSEGGREKSASVETLIAPRLGDEPDPDRKPEETTDRMAGVFP